MNRPTNRRELLQRATKHAYRTNRRAGWRAARQRALRWCMAMWPWLFIDRPNATED